jgi:hypothetical protein
MPKHSTCCSLFCSRFCNCALGISVLLADGFLAPYIHECYVLRREDDKNRKYGVLLLLPAAVASPKTEAGERHLGQGIASQVVESIAWFEGRGAPCGSRDEPWTEEAAAASSVVVATGRHLNPARCRG